MNNIRADIIDESKVAEGGRSKIDLAVPGGQNSYTLLKNHGNGKKCRHMYDKVPCHFVQGEMDDPGSILAVLSGNSVLFVVPDVQVGAEI